MKQCCCVCALKCGAVDQCCDSVTSLFESRCHEAPHLPEQQVATHLGKVSAELGYSV